MAAGPEDSPQQGGPGTTKTARKPSNRLELFAICGIVAPILFATIILVLGSVRTGYSHISQAISELGRVGTPNAIVQDANFMIGGILIVIFAYGLHKGIEGGKGSRIGPILLGFFGSVGMAADGIFSLPSPLHDPLGISGFIAFMLAPLVISKRLGRNPNWQGYRVYSIGTGVGAILLFLVLFSTRGEEPWFGAAQRSFVAPLFLWVEIMALRLWKLSG